MMKKVYSEVNEILNLLGEAYIIKLPKKLYNLILKSKDNEYKVKFNSIDTITISNCSKEAIEMIALFHLNYWCDNNKEKENLNQILIDNYVEKQEMHKEKFNADKCNIDKIEKKYFSSQVSVIEHKESILKIIINKIKKIFNKK